MGGAITRETGIIFYDDFDITKFNRYLKTKAKIKYYNNINNLDDDINYNTNVKSVQEFEQIIKKDIILNNNEMKRLRENLSVKNEIQYSEKINDDYLKNDMKEYQIPKLNITQEDKKEKEVEKNIGRPTISRKKNDNEKIYLRFTGNSFEIEG